MSNQQNLFIWNAVARPPKDAMKPIQAGRLKGKSDISPQWRMKAVTEIFGPCGSGWKYEIKRLWNEPADNGQVFAHALVDVYYKLGDVWSEPVPGIGGSMLITNEKNGPYSSDEGYKMAVTDALSVAFKALGVAADVYMGLWDGSKYATNTLTPEPTITELQAADIEALILEVGADRAGMCKFFNITDIANMPASVHARAVTMLESKRSKKAATNA